VIPSPSGSYPRRDGNLVLPLIGGPTAFARIADAVDAARDRVWLTVAFYHDDFRFPDGRSLFSVLRAAASRGVDVRAVFWRPNPESSGYGPTFSFDDAAREGAGLRLRWDRRAGVYCHHQKSWVVDDVAFVGGINLTVVATGRHDVYAEVQGPCATDVRHNFVQRWNEASERREADGNWGCDAADELPLSGPVGTPQGESTAQIQRMFGAERGILEQYVGAIDAAEHTIHIENQAIPIPVIAGPLAKALERGVEVLMIVPAVPEASVFRARKNPAFRAPFDAVEELGRHAGFRLAGLPVYVHAKLMIIDDVWATIGSCNLHSYSLGGHSEMNVSIWDTAVARGLRQNLMERHRAGLFTLDPERYGVD
jgi:cardiolipin synthase